MYRWWSFVMKLESSYATEAKYLRPKKRMLLFHLTTDKGFYTPCTRPQTRGFTPLALRTQTRGFTPLAVKYNSISK